MGQATLSAVTGIEGVETGAYFAQRHADRLAVGGGPIEVVPPLQPLFASGGIERGRVYALHGEAHLSLLFGLCSHATTHGSWLAIVNTPHVGFMSAHEHGVALHRVVNVHAQSHHEPHVVGALVDGFDLVAISSPTCSVTQARKIAARVKAQGSVLLVLGKPGAFEVDTSLEAHIAHWQFTTHAVSRTVRVSAQGRRSPQKRSCVVEMPSSRGSVREINI